MNCALCNRKLSSLTPHIEPGFGPVGSECKHKISGIRAKLETLGLGDLLEGRMVAAVRDGLSFAIPSSVQDLIKRARQHGITVGITPRPSSTGLSFELRVNPSKVAA